MMTRPPNTALCMYVVERELLTDRTVARLKVPLRWYPWDGRWKPERLRWYPWDAIEGGRLFPLDRFGSFERVGAWLLRDSPQHREVCAVLEAAGRPAPMECRTVGPLRRTHFGAVYVVPDESVTTSELVQERGQFVDVDAAWPREASRALYGAVAGCTDEPAPTPQPDPATFPRYVVQYRAPTWSDVDQPHATLEDAIGAARRLYADAMHARTVRVVDTGTGAVLMRRAARRGNSETSEEPGAA